MKPFSTEEEYEDAILRLENIFFAEPETVEGKEAEVLEQLIKQYESVHYPDMESSVDENEEID